MITNEACQESLPCGESRGMCGGRGDKSEVVCLLESSYQSVGDHDGST